MFSQQTAGTRRGSRLVRVRCVRGVRGRPGETGDEARTFYIGDGACRDGNSHVVTPAEGTPRTGPGAHRTPTRAARSVRMKKKLSRTGSLGRTRGRPGLWAGRGCCCPGPFPARLFPRRPHAAKLVPSCPEALTGAETPARRCCLRPPLPCREAPGSLAHGPHRRAPGPAEPLRRGRPSGARGRRAGTERQTGPGPRPPPPHGARGRPVPAPPAPPTSCRDRRPPQRVPPPSGFPSPWRRPAPSAAALTAAFRPAAARQ